MQFFSNIEQLLQRIGADVLEPVSYIPWGILGGFIFLILGDIKNKIISWNKTKESHKERRKWCLFLCGVYITVLLRLAFFSREPGSRSGLDLQLFSTWGTSVREHAFFIENIIMFIPFGLLGPNTIKIFRKGTVCILAGFLCSLLLEMSQLITQRGYCQLDDVLTNTIGTAFGWGAYKIWKYFHKEKIVF